MVSARHVARYDALCAVLAKPDLPCLPRRARRNVQPGDDVARRDVIKRDLAAAYIRYRMRDAGEDAQIVSVRRYPLRLAQKSA